MVTRRRNLAGILIVVLALLATACGGDVDDDAAPTDDTEETTDEKTSSEVDPASIKTDFGADATTIRVGMVTDLSGPFSTLVKDIVLAQQVYWEKLNQAGGIGGRQIQLVIEDTKYDVPTHKQKFQAMKAQDANGVLIISQSGGSPHTAAIKAELEASNLIAIPLSWYSGWADPAFGKNVFEAYSNYCFEAMNSLQYLYDNQGAKTLAIATFPGEAGQDAAKGAKVAAEKLGMKIVYDGEAKVIPPTPTNPNPDHSGVANSIASSGADLVWVVANPSALAQLMGQAAAKGFKGKWSSIAPTYNETLLKSDVKNVIDSSYFLPGYAVTLGTDVPGMKEMVDAIKTARPDARASDAYVYGWTEAQITEAILRHAAHAGDLTRAGVVKAAFELDQVDFGGLAPAQTWKGDPNSYVVRETYMFKPKLSLYKEGPIGVGNTGSELLEGPFASEISKSYDFQGPCYKPTG